MTNFEWLKKHKEDLAELLTIAMDDTGKVYGEICMWYCSKACPHRGSCPGECIDSIDNKSMVLLWLDSEVE